MQFQYTPYILPLIAAASISGWMVFYAWQRRSIKGSAALALLALAITEWSFCYAWEIAGTDLPTKLFWGKIQYVGIALVPLMWLIFAVNHSNPSKPLNYRSHILLAIIPLITIGLALTTDVHGLVFKEAHIVESEGFSTVAVSRSFWFWVHSTYSYLLILAGTIVILRKIGSLQLLFRRQAATLLAAVLAPWAGNIVYLSGLSPIPYLDLTPFAFTFSVVVLTWSIFGFRLVELAPIAREIVIEEMGDGMIVLDAQDRIADINPSALTMVGLSAAQAIGRPALDVLSPWPQLTRKYGDVKDAVDEITFGEGETRRWYELSLSSLHNRRKQFLGRVITVRNITKRRQAEEQLRQLSRAVEASPSSIVITDLLGIIQYVNPKFSQVTGYSFEEVLGKNPRILKTDETPADVHRQLWETITSGHEWRGQFCNRKKNGEFYWESASISPINDSAGRITHYVAVKDDITEFKRTQDALALARDQALEASHLKSQLLAKVSHELRTPLGGILGYAELLRTDAFGSLSEEQKRIMAQIIESTRYLNTIINELLDQAQIEARKLILRSDNFSPREMLRRVETSMAVLASSKGLTLITSVAPDLPDLMCGDEHRLQQILINLVGNAIKFTAAGEVRVNLFHPDQAHWIIQVSDTGVGIPKEAQPYVFDPFRQVDSAITAKNRGTGLGLSITRQLVDLMGGQITLESQAGLGSTFTVLLPIAGSTSNGGHENLPI